MDETKDNEIRATPDAVPEEPALSMRLGRTTFLLDLHYADKGKETVDDKVKRLILKDLNDGNF